jgi:uncharacterized protein YceH (UPF0502 family)
VSTFSPGDTADAASDAASGSSLGAPFDEVEARILGALAEKQLTTPQQYPLTLNSLILACNQTTNRDPVVNYGEAEVEPALERLKERRLVRFVHPSHGRSAIRYRQVLDEQLSLDDRQLALLAVLLLRGPQTPGELRARTERMARFDGVSEVEVELERLCERGGLVARLPRQPGRKEDRFGELLSERARQPESEGSPWAAPTETAQASRHEAQGRGSQTTEELQARLDQLVNDVAALRSDVDRILRELGMARPDALRSTE